MRYDDLWAAIAAYLEQCYARETPPRAQELAQALLIAPATLRRLCNTRYGQPPSALLKNAQAQRARDLLKSSDLSMANVAYKAAFGSRRTLFRVFARREGATPTRVRHRLRKDDD